MKDDGKACLADFGLMSIVLDPETTDITSSTGDATKGTHRWMGPELFYPKEFGLPKFQLTKESDCYAFGMVIYEVSSRPGGPVILPGLFNPYRSYRVRFPLKDSNNRGRCPSQCLKEPARIFQMAFLQR